MQPTHSFDATTGRFSVIRAGKTLGVVAKKSRGRWQFRDAETGKLYASGMTPEQFVAQFWGGTLESDLSA